MSERRTLLRPAIDPPTYIDGRPVACQRGHPLTWLLEGNEPSGDGSVLGGCACTARPEKQGGNAGSTPIVWRHIRGQVLRPLLPSTNRMAFALAVKLFDALHGERMPELQGHEREEMVKRTMPHLRGGQTLAEFAERFPSLAHQMPTPLRPPRDPKEEDIG